MLTVKKNQILKLLKPLKGLKFNLNVGDKVLVLKGGKNPVLLSMYKDQKLSFTFSGNMKDFFEFYNTEGEKEKDLSRISFKNVNYLETYSGVSFSADVLLDRKLVGVIENSGCGGETCERFYGKKENEALKEIISIIDKYRVNIFEKVNYQESNGDKIESLLNYIMNHDYVFLSFEVFSMKEKELLENQS